MAERSEAFDKALKKSHEVIARADVWLAGQPVLRDLPVESGTIKVQRGIVRRTADLVLVETHQPARDAVFDALSRFGAEVHTRRGIRYLNGTVEWVPTGVCRVKKLARQRGQIRVDLADRGYAIGRDVFRTPRTSSRGMTYIQQVQAFAGETIPNLRTIDTTNHGTAIPPMVWEDDRAAAMTQIAAAAGAEVGFDADGALRTARPKLLEDPSDWQVSTRDAVSSLSQDVDFESLYNVVTADGERPDGTPPAHGEASDDDPDSPTFVGLARQVRKYFSPLLLSDTQAQAAAASILARSRGARRQLSLEAVCHPAMDYGWRIDVSDVAARTYERHIVDAASFGWTSAGMTVETRATGSIAEEG